MNPTTPPPSPMKKLRAGLKKLTTGSPTRLSPTKLSPMRLSPTWPSHKKLNPKSSVMVDPNFGPSLKRKLKEELKEMVGYDYETKRKRQKLRPHGSFSAEYWSQASDLALHLHDCTLVKHELSSRETGNDTSAEWLAPQVKALQTESRLYQQQAERLRMEPGDREGQFSCVDAFVYNVSMRTSNQFWHRGTRFERTDCLSERTPNRLRCRKPRRRYLGSDNWRLVSRRAL
jgi:hypothetical protein